MALTNKLTALGDAVREKAELTEKMTLDQMAETISNLEIGSAPNVEEIAINKNGTYTPDEGVDGFNKVVVDVEVSLGDMPEELLILTGDQSYRFYASAWQAFIDTYGNQVQTRDLTKTEYMFGGLNIQELPFSINGSSTGSGMSARLMFNRCYLQVCPIITGKIDAVEFMFQYCENLQTPPDFTEIDISPLLNDDYEQEGSVCNCCYSIRSLPMTYYKKLKNRTIPKNQSHSPYRRLNKGNYNVDEIINMPVMTLDAYTSNAFYQSFEANYCLKNFTFETQEDGTPYIASGWRGSIIDLTPAGFSYEVYMIYNSGRDANKRIYNEETYQLYKDDIDSYAAGGNSPVHYSRYDKASAIRTINSLPDVSGSGGTNTIKFRGEAGLKTDNGAINTMTEEEIAVATAKGWTVSFT